VKRLCIPLVYTYLCGGAAGAIVVQWNVKDLAGQKGAAGMWDSHIRLVQFSLSNSNQFFKFPADLAEVHQCNPLLFILLH
jgi:hypothetical protein